MLDTIVLIPTYNERGNIEKLLAGFLDVCEEAMILVIDDNSPDHTGEIVDSLAADSLRIKVLHRPGKLGYGSALRDGFRYALRIPGIKYILTMDADLSHDFVMVPRLRQQLQTFDVAIGSRYVKGGSSVGWPLARRTLSRLANFYARSLTGLPVRDCTSGFRGYRKEVLDSLPLASILAEGYSFLVETLYYCHRLGWSMTEIPIVFANRSLGASKLSASIALEGARVVLGIGWRRFNQSSPAYARNPRC